MRRMPVSLRRDSPQSAWSILCDFDGTIALDDVVDLLLERYALPGWESLEQRWREGKIGSLECMRGQVELLDVGPAELHAFVDSVAIDPAFPAFVARARALGMPLRVVSDGLDSVIRRILARHGLGDLPVVANELLAAERPGRWRLNSPYTAAGCRSGTCKCALVEPPREEGIALTLMIGDGASDFCVAGKSDLVFAKSKLIEYCRREGIPHQPIAGFADASRLLPTLADPTHALPFVIPLAPSQV
jgi:2-hydroxy-3-keto-5-methylthiopentenyl-1-phosphate phosphatase